jgi:hypothetical protein
MVLTFGGATQLYVPGVVNNASSSVGDAAMIAEDIIIN